MLRTPLASLFALVLLACGGESPMPAPPTAKPPTDASHERGDHGAVQALGEVALIGRRLAIAREGEVHSGEEAAFTVDAVPAGAVDLGALSLFLWIESADGTALSAPARGTKEGQGLHFHAVPRAGAAEPATVVLRLRADGKDERVALPLDGHGHVHEATPHHGVMVEVKDASGAIVAHAEVKLHDDKGDIELWLYQDPRGEEPYDLPLTVTPELTLIDVGDRKVQLAVRNTDRNEDEDDQPNVRSGRTNYFVFPGATGADSSWLTGATFSSVAALVVAGGEQRLASVEFVLVPHVHAEGESHD